MPSAILSILDCRTVRFAEHHEHLLVATMDTASRCTLYDLNRTDIVQVFTDSDISYSASENFRNVASLDATGNLVLSDATLWDRRCPTKPLFHFDRITEHFSGQFHPNNRHVIIDRSVWDLRTLSMLLSCPALHQATVHAFDYGSRLAAFQEPDYGRTSSTVSIIDGQTYEAIRVLDMKPMLKSFAVAKNGVLFAGIQDSETEVAVRIYSFGMEADEERYVAESEEPIDDELDDSDSELDLDDRLDDDDEEDEDDDSVSSSSLYSSEGSHSAAHASSHDGGVDNEASNGGIGGGDDIAVTSSNGWRRRRASGRLPGDLLGAAAAGGTDVLDRDDVQSEGAMST
jgi:hypothetical protein